jgi:hypothetical protein
VEPGRTVLAGRDPQLDLRGAFERTRRRRSRDRPPLGDDVEPPRDARLQDAAAALEASVLVGPGGATGAVWGVLLPPSTGCRSSGGLVHFRRRAL